MTTFNGVVLDNLVKIEDIRLDVLPPIDVPIVQGISRAYARKKRLSPRLIEIDIRLIEDDHETVITKAKELAHFLNVDENKPLITRRRPNEFIMAQIYGGTPIEQLLHTGSATLTFICDEAVYYSEVVFQDLASGTNNGTLPAKPVLKFTASGPSQSIISVGHSLYFEGLTSGDVVEIDTVTGIVTVNGGSGNINEVLTSRSDLFELPVGEWSITGATATYRERNL